jgi:hypothetical protein
MTELNALPLNIVKNWSRGGGNQWWVAAAQMHEVMISTTSAQHR